MRRFILHFLCLAALVIAGCARIAASPVPAGPPPTDIATEELVHYAVVSADGQPLGPVHGLVMQIKTGTVAYVVVLLADKYHYGKGAYGPPDDDYLLIPWSHVKLDAARHILVVDVDAARLDEVPVLDDLPDPALPNWDVTLRQFWAGV